MSCAGQMDQSQSSAESLRGTEGSGPSAVCRDQERMRSGEIDDMVIDDEDICDAVEELEI